MSIGDSDDRAPPGSREARDAGCRCPVYDNAHGRGYMGMPGVYVMSELCPMHGEWLRREPPGATDGAT